MRVCVCYSRFLFYKIKIKKIFDFVSQQRIAVKASLCVYKCVVRFVFQCVLRGVFQGSLQGVLQCVVQCVVQGVSKGALQSDAV